MVDMIILPTKEDAEEIINQLSIIISKSDFATIEDLYELLGVSGDVDETLVWVDIQKAEVVKVSKGYQLKLPSPKPLI